MRHRRLAGLAGILATLSCGRGAEQSQPSPQTTPLPTVVRLSADAVRAAGIETAIVGEGRISQTLALTGTLAAKPWTAEEQTVLSDAESADARSRLAEANFERISRLSAGGITSRQDLDSARAERDQAQAAAAQADSRRANLGLSETSKSLERRAKIWGLGNLPEIDLHQVQPEERVDVTTEAFPNSRFAGRVVGVSQSADPDTRNFTVRIAIDDPSARLRPQMLAKFLVATATSTGLAIPRSALLLEGDGSYVYLEQDGTFRRQRVRTGASTPDEVQGDEGLSAGERIVTRGAQILESERLKSRFKPAEEDED